jgi:hypothetical protein
VAYPSCGIQCTTQILGHLHFLLEVLLVSLFHLVLLLVFCFRRFGGDRETALLEPDAVQTWFSPPVLACSPLSNLGGLCSAVTCMVLCRVTVIHSCPWVNIVVSPWASPLGILRDVSSVGFFSIPRTFLRPLRW